MQNELLLCLEFAFVVNLILWLILPFCRMKIHQMTPAWDFGRTVCLPRSFWRIYLIQNGTGDKKKLLKWCHDGRHLARAKWLKYIVRLAKLTSVWNVHFNTTHLCMVTPSHLHQSRQRSALLSCSWRCGQSGRLFSSRHRWHLLDVDSWIFFIRINISFDRL